ncbi:MAG: hypothetical protein KIH01_09140, partial [Candidatus Freyarchaeota archaeon]|nr:hypothetical protein [Candidatus Jordarchaeia archaeon]
AYGSIPLNIVQLESMNYPIFIRLKYQGRIIASLWVHATAKVSEFWSGFWDGIREKLPGIIVTATVMVILAIPTHGGSLLAYVKDLLASAVIPSLLAVGVASNIREIFEAYSAYTKMDGVAEELDSFSQRAAYAGYLKTYSFFQGLKDKIKGSQGLIVGSMALDLVTDVTIRDVFIVFGKDGATEYEKGKAMGRLVGTALSLIGYATTYYRFLSEGPKLLSLGGKIRAFLRGVYNWITPPLWDVGVIAGKLTARGIAASLAFSEDSGDFKQRLNKVDEEALGSLVKSTCRFLDDALEVSSRLELSEEAFHGLLRAYEKCELSEEAWGKLIQEVEDIGGKSKKCADELLRFVSHAESDGVERVILEIAPKLAELSSEELEGLGKALSSIRAEAGESFKNGFKLLHTYFAVEKHYGKRVAKIFLENIVKHPERLDAWVDASTRGLKAVFLEPDSRDSLIIEGKGVEPGVYRVIVVDPETGEIVAEGVRGTVEENEQDVIKEKKTLRFREARFDTDKDYLTIFMKYGVEDFFNELKTQPEFVRLSGKDRVTLVTGKQEPVAELNTVMKTKSGSVYLEFDFADIDGKKCTFRLTSDGKLSLVDVVEGNARYYNVEGLDYKVFDDGAGGEAVRLLAVEYVKGRTKYLVVRRNIPDDTTYYLGNRDGVIKVEADQQTKKIGKDLETILGEDEFNKLKGELTSGKAVVGLVYLGEDGEIHHLWSTTLEYNLRKHPAREILGLYVVKMEGASASELGGARVKLVSGDGGHRLLVTGIEDLESIPVGEPCFELSSQDYVNLKMPLLGGEALSIHVSVDEQGKLYCSNLKIQEGNTFYDLKILEYTPEMS